MTKYNIGDILADDDGNSGVVVIKWDDGDICDVENDAAHPDPIIVLSVEEGDMQERGIT